MNCLYCTYTQTRSPQTLVSTWGLTAVINVDKKQIEFTYGSGIGSRGCDNRATCSISYCPVCGRKL